MCAHFQLLVACTKQGAAGGSMQGAGASTCQVIHAVQIEHGAPGRLGEPQTQLLVEVTVVQAAQARTVRCRTETKKSATVRALVKAEAQPGGLRACLLLHTDERVIDSVLTECQACCGPLPGSVPAAPTCRPSPR